MDLRYRLIDAGLRTLSAVRAGIWLPRPADVSGLVVTLHHVRPAPATPFQPNAILSVTPDFLERFISTAKQSGQRFVGLEEILFGPDGARSARRIAITLDDGFRDNAKHALPIFRRHQVPFHLFVCPGFCDRRAELWWEALEAIIRDNDEIAADGADGGSRIPARTAAQKRAAFAALTRRLTSDLDEDRQRAAIRGLAAAHGLDLAQLAGNLTMDWEEVRAIAAEPLCAIGAHTMSHPALARLPAERAIAEMRDSADRIERELGRRPWAIAFPYGTPGAAGAREARLAAEAGFKASFTTRPGYIATGAGAHGLPRVSLNGLFQDPGLVQPLLEPGLWRLRDRLRRPFSDSPEAGPAAASTR